MTGKDHTNNRVFVAACWFRVLSTGQLICPHRSSLLWCPLFLLLSITDFICISIITWTTKLTGETLIKQKELLALAWICTIILFFISSLFQSYEANVFGNLSPVAKHTIAFLALQITAILTWLFSYCQRLNFSGLFLLIGFFLDLFWLDFLSRAFWSSTLSFHNNFCKIEDILVFQYFLT